MSKFEQLKSLVSTGPRKAVLATILTGSFAAGMIQLFKDSPNEHGSSEVKKPDTKEESANEMSVEQVRKIEEVLAQLQKEGIIETDGVEWTGNKNRARILIRHLHGDGIKPHPEELKNNYRVIRIAFALEQAGVSQVCIEGTSFDQKILPINVTFPGEATRKLQKNDFSRIFTLSPEEFIANQAGKMTVHSFLPSIMETRGAEDPAHVAEDDVRRKRGLDASKKVHEIIESLDAIARSLGGSMSVNTVWDAGHTKIVKLQAGVGKMGGDTMEKVIKEFDAEEIRKAIETVLEVQEKTKTNGEWQIHRDKYLHTLAPRTAIVYGAGHKGPQTDLVKKNPETSGLCTITPKNTEADIVTINLRARDSRADEDMKRLYKILTAKE